MNENLIEIRKYLHANPELSEQEYETANFIYKHLQKTKANEVLKITDTAVVAVFEGKEKGKTTMLRADIDALPIQEINDFEHRSKTDNVSHKCGHDGHATVMLGVAQKLSENPISSGKVILLFQPAEENGKGASAALSSAYFENLAIDFVFAFHNLPGFPTNEIVIKEGPFTSNVSSMIIKLKGKTAHAAEPEMGYNPSVAIAKIVLEANKLVKNQPSEPDFFLITTVYSQLGELAYGISAGDGEVHFTIRAWDKDLFTKKVKLLEESIQQICDEEKLSLNISWTEEFDANLNDTKSVEIIETAANNSNLSITVLDNPFKWGEDFGLFTQKFKGAMFGIGAGEDTPALHNPDYDFPDEIIPTGVEMFYQITTELHA